MTRKTGLVFFPAYDYAISPTHPEREERLLYTQDQVLEEGLFDFDNIREFKPGIATPEDICRVHFCVPDLDTVAHASHLIAAGGCLTAADKVMSGEVDNAFALVRPPGHHSFRVVHGSRGFCTLNIEAVMVEYIRHKYGVRRIAIVDTDCHHGDGSQDIFWHDPDVLFISLHQDGRTLYPGSGFVDELGGPNAFGATINLPLPPGTGEQGFLYVLDDIVMPIVEAWKPDLVVNSAGQDNHYSDPITQMAFTAHGYAELNRRLAPDICVLEGGYSIQTALPYVNTGIILAMAGLDIAHVREPDYDAFDHRQPGEITDYLRRLKEAVFEQWHARSTLKRRFYPDGEFHTRSKDIFYDTDGLREHQRETVRICPDCGGTIVTDSRCDDTGNRILGITIPFHACDACRHHGEHQYEAAPSGRNLHVILQDKDRDRYLVRT
ncbi:histone deacetylase [Xanthobacteraceae bacterium Astr-EGSB]|uniref:histone deacetylase family protein n=1 Tax=Astrobacterium formosum TaxID=3069710 RepID=UPI0027B12812|nr:histone deacetylase [Xanthobacteraceae bacterium Astr-EGSB]